MNKSIMNIPFLSSLLLAGMVFSGGCSKKNTSKLESKPKVVDDKEEVNPIDTKRAELLDKVKTHFSWVNGVNLDDSDKSKVFDSITGDILEKDEVLRTLKHIYDGLSGIKRKKRFKVSKKNDTKSVNLEELSVSETDVTTAQGVLRNIAYHYIKAGHDVYGGNEQVNTFDALIDTLNSVEELTISEIGLEDSDIRSSHMAKGIFPEFFDIDKAFSEESARGLIAILHSTYNNSTIPFSVKLGSNIKLNDTNTNKNGFTSGDKSQLQVYFKGWRPGSRIFVDKSCLHDEFLAKSKKYPCALDFNINEVKISSGESLEQFQISDLNSLRFVDLLIHTFTFVPFINGMKNKNALFCFNYDLVRSWYDKKRANHYHQNRLIYYNKLNTFNDWFSALNDEGSFAQKLVEFLQNDHIMRWLLVNAGGNELTELGNWFKAQLKEWLGIFLNLPQFKGRNVKEELDALKGSINEKVTSWKAIFNEGATVESLDVAALSLVGNASN